jgi:hypothetical protein
VASKWWARRIIKARRAGSPCTEGGAAPATTSYESAPPPYLDKNRRCSGWRCRRISASCERGSINIRVRVGGGVGVPVGRTFAGQEQVLGRAQLLPAQALPPLLNTYFVIRTGVASVNLSRNGTDSEMGEPPSRLSQAPVLQHY